MLTHDQQVILDRIKSNLSIEIEKEPEYGSDKVYIHIYLKMGDEYISEDYVTIYNQ